MRKAGASLRLSSLLKCAENPHEIGLKYVGARLQSVRRADYLPFALYPRYCTGIFPFSRSGGRRPISVRAIILRGAFLSGGCAPFRNRRVSGRLFIEEIRFLPPFLLLRAGDVDLFVRIGILSGVEHHRRKCHRRGGEVLHLFEVEMEFAEDFLRQRTHVAFGAAGVRRDEVGNQLVGKSFAAADALEIGGQPLEERERRFAHQFQHGIFGVFGRDFQSSRRVVFYDRIEIGTLVEQVVADAAADESLPDPLHGPYLGIEFHERPVVVVEVGALFRMQTRRAAALGAERAVAAAEPVHVGRGAAHVGEAALETGHAGDALHLGEDRTLAARVDELALMGRDGAERAAAEAAAVEVDREFDHLPRRNIPLARITRMGRPLVGQVERAVELLGREGRQRRVDHDEAVARGFDERVHRLHEVALGLDDGEVLAEGAVVARALLVGVQTDRGPGVEAVDIAAVREEGHLPDLAEQLGVVAVAHGTGHLLHDSLAHAVDQKVGAAVGEDRRHHRVAPVVVVGQPAQRSLDAAGDHGRVGKEPLEDPRVDRDGAVGAETRLAARRVGVVVAQAQVGRVVVDHRVHRAARDAEEQTRRAQLGEVAQVVAPVGLRHDRHPIALGFEQPSDDGGAEGRMIDIGVAREEDDVEAVPAEGAYLLEGGGQEHGRSVRIRRRETGAPRRCSRPTSPRAAGSPPAARSRSAAPRPCAGVRTRANGRGAHGGA